MFLYTQKFFQVGGATQGGGQTQGAGQTGGAQTVKAEFQNITQSFQQADTNGDKSLDKSEFTNAGGTDAQFAKLDTNGDKKLSMEEFNQIMEKQNQGAEKQGGGCKGGKCGGAGEAKKAEAAGEGGEDEELIKKLMAMGLSKEEATALAKAMKKDPELAKKVEAALASGDKDALKKLASTAMKKEKMSGDNQDDTTKQAQYTPPVDKATKMAA